jgi:putative transposase
LLIAVVVIEANCPERLGGAAVVLEASETATERLSMIWVDQGFSGPNFARVVNQLTGAEVEVICRHSAEFEVLPKRWIVERTFAWWNGCRRLSKDYEVLPEMSQAMIYGVMTRLMLRRLVKLQEQA